MLEAKYIVQLLVLFLYILPFWTETDNEGLEKKNV